jgi:hypothetical protein
VLILSPVSNGGGTFHWDCSSTTGTDVSPKYLPSSCR